MSETPYSDQPTSPVEPELAPVTESHPAELPAVHHPEGELPPVEAPAGELLPGDEPAGELPPDDDTAVPVEAGHAEEPAAEQPIGDLITSELALTIENTEPPAPVVPDLSAEPPAATQQATNLDLPSLDLPFGGDLPAPGPQPASAPEPSYQHGERYAQQQYAQPTYAPQPAQPAYAPQPAQQPYGQQPAQQPYGQQPYGQQLAYPPQLSPGEESTWASGAHWSAIVASFVGLGFLGPLLVMLIQGPKSARVRANAVESLNFEITYIMAMIVSAILLFLIVGIVGLIAFPIAWLVLRIVAAVQTSNGQDYRYPVNIRLVK